MKTSYTAERLGRYGYASPLSSHFFVKDTEGVLLNPTLTGCAGCNGKPDALEMAGPRRRIFLDSSSARIGIITCGGLCPGLNDVIRAVTLVAWYRYGVRDIMGFRYGYSGLVAGTRYKPIKLTPRTVKDIHKAGGTILGSSRGPQDTHAMVDYLQKNRIDALFAIGGDGTQTGALAIANEIQRRKLKIAVVGVPKTIDNDICFTERTFGFETAVAMSQAPITGIHMEAQGAMNGIGLVKLMGRDSGFIAAHATLASSDVNLLLIPEVPFTIKGLTKYLDARLRHKSHAVIVVAEGAGQDLVPVEGHDASGNRKLGDIGLFLKKKISEHFTRKAKTISVKYVDPSYTIRSAPASADDSVFCFQLGENAVHAAMAGRTKMVVGTWNGHFVHIPTQLAVSKRKRVDTSSLLWQSVLDNTGQPVDLL